LRLHGRQPVSAKQTAQKPRNPGLKS